VRAQTPALPLFAVTLWLLVDASRRGLRRRTLLVLPLLALWSNVHGSVVLGALLVVLLGLTELVRRRSVGPALALVIVAPLCTLASPYLWKLPAYYDLMLVSPPFKDILREWAWSKPGATTLLFYLLAALAVVLLALARSRSRLTVFELVVIAITLVGAVQAVRGVIWFSLAAFAILPVALDGVLRRPDVVAPRVNRTISGVAIAALVTAAVSAGFRPTSWFLEDWPRQEADAVAAATRDPATRLFATDRHSDWLLWRLPSLRGRIAFDVRFELYDRPTLEDIVRYNGELTPDWKEIADGYDVVVLDEQKPPSHLDDFLAEPGTKLLYRDGEIAIVSRRGRR
jgi:hypothetical protein